MFILSRFIEVYVSHKIIDHVTPKRYNETVDSSVHVLMDIIHRNTPKFLGGNTPTLKKIVGFSFTPIKWVAKFHYVYKCAQKAICLSVEHAIRSNFPNLIQQALNWTYNELIPIAAAIMITKVISLFRLFRTQFSLNSFVVAPLSFYFYNTHFFLYVVILSKFIRLAHSVSHFIIRDIKYDKNFFYALAGEKNLIDAVWPMIGNIKLLGMQITEK